jgi:hypothetical protein
MWAANGTTICAATEPRPMHSAASRNRWALAGGGGREQGGGAGQQRDEDQAAVFDQVAQRDE